MRAWGIGAADRENASEKATNAPTADGPLTVRNSVIGREFQFPRRLVPLLSNVDNVSAGQTPSQKLRMDFLRCLLELDGHGP